MLSDADTATTSFAAPDVETATDLTFELEVSDGNGGRDTDSTTVTVEPVNEPPRADAGDDFTLSEGTTGTLRRIRRANCRQTGLKPDTRTKSTASVRYTTSSSTKSSTSRSFS